MIRYVCFFIVGLVASSASGQKPAQWVVTAFEFSGVESSDVSTFQSLLVSELRDASQQTVLQSQTACRDDSCAHGVAIPHGAPTVIFGRLSRLGKKIIVDLRAIDATKSRAPMNQRLTVDQIEDLEAASKRFAKAFVEQAPIAQGAELGTVTANEARTDRRKQGDSGVSLKVGGSLPLTTSVGGYGALLDVGYWFETRDFIIEPRLGFRWSIDEDDDAYFHMTALDIFLSKVFSSSDFAPLLGFGAGLRSLEQGIVDTFEVGEVIRLEGERLEEEGAWGLGLAARGGLLFLRTYDTRIALTVDYDVTLVDLHDQGSVHMLNAGLSVIF